MKLWDEQLEGMREEARNMLQFLPALSQPDASLDPLTRARLIREGFGAVMGNAPKSARAEATTIPGPAGAIPVRIFRPKGKARGLYLHLHGGGWILGNPEMGDAGNERLAEQIRSRRPLRRLSPGAGASLSRPDPTIARRLLPGCSSKGMAEFGSDRLFIGGESAGGHLTLRDGPPRSRSTAKGRSAAGAQSRVRLVRRQRHALPARQRRPSRHARSGGAALHGRLLHAGLGEEARREPDISPLFADLEGLPLEPDLRRKLRSSARRLALPRAAARVAGVDVELQVYPDSPHGFRRCRPRSRRSSISAARSGSSA